jgi:hypothetical protein
MRRRMHASQTVCRVNMRRRMHASQTVCRVDVISI